jgi:hypothetical protein
MPLYERALTAAYSSKLIGFVVDPPLLVIVPELI